MDYGSLIHQAWTMTWRHRFLWVVGLFAGGTVTPSCSFNVQWRGDLGDLERVTPELELLARDVVRWVEANLGLVIAVAIVFALVVLVGLVVALIAQGAMAHATVELANRRPVALGHVWAVGRRLFWRYVGLWLLLAFVGVGAALSVILLLLVVIGLANVVRAPGVLIALLALVLGLPLLLAFFALVIALSIIAPYAQRAIVVQDVGPRAALRAAVALVRSYLGESLLIWLISLGLGIGVGLAGLVVVIPVVAVLGGVGFALWSAFGLTAPTVAFGTAGLLLLVVFGAVVTAIANTFFWHYWTRAYLRLAALAGQAAGEV